MKIGIIGAGNMAEALINGLLKSESADCSNIFASNHNRDKANRLKAEYGINIYPNDEVIKSCSFIILSVKPKDITGIIKQYKDILSDKIIISVAAGVPIADMETAGSHLKIVRAMPNTPVQVCSGAFVAARGSNITDEDMEKVERIFSPLGFFAEAGEDKMDAVSALSGCSPAYIYQIIEAMSDAGVRMGLSRDTALKLAAVTVQGAGQTVYETGIHPACLKDKVTSPAGTTIEGVYEMERSGVRAGIMAALDAAYRKTLSFSKKR